MTDIFKDCANPDCGLPFKPKVHNAIYCGPECRTVVMNKRILERYHQKKLQRKNNEPRECARKNCNHILSRYNKENICESCKEVRLDNRLRKWGWSEEEIQRRER